MPSFRFVDGDLIEEYLNLPQEKKELVVKDLYLEDLDQLANNVVQASNAPPAIKRTSIDVVTLVRMIEDITRIH